MRATNINWPPLKTLRTFMRGGVIVTTEEHTAKFELATGEQVGTFTFDGATPEVNVHIAEAVAESIDNLTMRESRSIGSRLAIGGQRISRNQVMRLRSIHAPTASDTSRSANARNE